MTYPNDPNRNRRPLRDADTSYTSWIIGGLVAFAVIAGLFMMFGRNVGTNSASTTSDRPVATAPSSNPAPNPGTTGSGSTSPTPAAR